MPRSCSVCADTRLALVDQALVSGVAVDEIARRYPPLSATSIRRHRAEHVSQTLAKAQEAGEVVRGDDLLDQVKKLKEKSLSLLLKAEAAGDYRTALAGIREARSCLELLLEVEGELNRNPVVNVILSSEWTRLRAVIIGALAPYPDARLAVAARLVDVEAGQ